MVVADLDDAGGKRVAEEIAAAGGTASFQHADVSSADDVDALIAHAVGAHGGLHLAVNNAGSGHAPAPCTRSPSRSGTGSRP